MTTEGLSKTFAIDGKLQSVIESLVEVANAYIVDSPETLEQAGVYASELKRSEKSIDTAYKVILKPYADARKIALDEKRGHLEPIVAAGETLKTKIVTFTRAQRVAHEAAVAVARKKAETEAKRQRTRTVKTLEKLGQTSQAEAMAAAPLVAKPVVVTAPPKPSSFVTRHTWSARVDNLGQLVKAVSEGIVPLDALQPNQVFLNGLAVQMRQSMAVPGVSAIRTDGIAMKGR